MIETQNNKESHAYFAAANGYLGFKSYFSKVFNPKNFESIYILKGGPGTGKSSLIREIFQCYSEKYDCELIYCSSDPKSLDGLIIYLKEKAIAIIDGTAPHQTDPEYPGTIEKIINLGENWDESILKSNRKNIENLNFLKKEAYKSAYNYLKIAGQIDDYVNQKIASIINRNLGDEIHHILNDITTKGSSNIRLISSYGKNGFGYLNTFEKSAKKTYKVVGLYGSEYIAMNEIKKEAERQNLSYILSPSPLSEARTEAMFFEEEKIAIIAGKRIPEQSSILIDTSVMFDTQKLSNAKSELEFLWREHETFLWSAADAFAKASDYHFELEKIYTASMNFSENKNIIEKIKNEIEKI